MEVGEPGSSSCQLCNATVTWHKLQLSEKIESLESSQISKSISPSITRTVHLIVIVQVATELYILCLHKSFKMQSYDWRARCFHNFKMQTARPYTVAVSGPNEKLLGSNMRISVTLPWSFRDSTIVDQLECVRNRVKSLLPQIDTFTIPLPDWLAVYEP